MRTDFAEIDALAASTLDREYETPTIPPVFKFVAGFELPDRSRRDQLVNGRRGEIDNFRRERKALIDELAKHEVTPLAVLPKTMWNRICEESGLYRFKPDSEGKIRVNARDGDYFAIVAGLVGLALWLAPVVALAYVACTMYWPGTPTLMNWAVLVSLIGTVVSYVVMATGFKFEPFIAVHVVLARTMARLYDMMPHEWQIRRLLPKMKGLTNSESKISTRIILPPMPDDVAAIIEQAVLSRHTLRVAVVPDGFCFEDRASDLFVQRVADRATDRATRVRKSTANFFANLDPIIYIATGSVVAVVAQFGEFPIEREAVMRAMDAEYEAIGAGEIVHFG
jgi:hypothetical protein